ncbi:MAG: ferredoxin [Mycobacterium sp.]|uniref:ferredoxin n=1 Tax=Mycobacterium sp. TaxID=1785 RepID=UPI003F992018
MKSIVIDEGLCMGSRECAGIAAEAVEFDPDGIASATDAELPDAIAQRMAASCPAMAITVKDI